MSKLSDWFTSTRPVATALQRAVDVLAALAKKWIGDKVKFDKGQGPGGFGK